MQNQAREIPFNSHSGYTMIASSMGLIMITGLSLFSESGVAVAAFLLGVLVSIFLLAGLYTLQPNQGAVLTLFGNYQGTDRNAGIRWANPFVTKKKISLRARNFVSETIKVNDKRGNPIEIAAAIVWRVSDTAQASFNVEDYEAYVRVTSEASVRHLASCYAYDHMDDQPDGEEITLRSGGESITRALMAELAEKLSHAGVAVDDAKLTHLAYAPEIAGAMLRRQQAQAVLAARRIIVQGAVGMVEMALTGLSERGLVELDDERRAAMVSNLLVVLVGERDAQPVINSGTLYS